ncbi:MAG: Rhodoferax phage [Pseudomonadota bacterium]|jgi:hypothetical protein
MSVQDESQQIDQTQGNPTEVDASQQTTEQTSTEVQGTEEGQQQEEQAQGNEGQQTERDEKGRFKGVQPRIDELTRARREAEREAAYWRQVAQGTQSPAQAAPQRPVPENFEKYDEYIDALTDWKAEQAVAKRMEADSTRKVAETRAQTFQERQAQFRQQAPDYDEVVASSDAPLSNHVAEVLQDSDLGPQLAYHFAKNPDVLLRLNGMNPTAAAREIGRLEATLSAKPAAPAAPTKKVSNTPAPAGTLGTQGRATTPALQNLSMDEYMKQRKAQGARWAR